MARFIVLVILLFHCDLSRLNGFFMRLLIDIGNSRIKWLFVENEAQISLTDQAHAITHYKDFPLALIECFGEGSEFEKLLSTCSQSRPQKVLVSNVAGDQAAAAVKQFVQKRWQMKMKFAEVKREQAGIHNDYIVLSELGIDRWMAVIGARQVFPDGDIVIINCGTAITVDVLNSANHFLGGAILPGFQLAAKSLSVADGIAEINPAAVERVIGCRTSECVQVGILSACVGGVELLIGKIKSELNNKSANLLLTGGGAQLFLSASDLEYEYDANVVMRGQNRLIECEC